MNDLRHNLGITNMEKLTFLAANLKVVEARGPLKIDYHALDFKCNNVRNTK